MSAIRPIHALLLTAGMSILSTPALAQPSDAASAAPTDTKRVYTPADFARFAPKTAYDMLVQIPSFTIRTADQERGLGQASENVLVNGQRITDKSGGAVDQLKRTSAASVERIEIVEAGSLGIPGLSGQVANVILKTQAKGSGQFSWNPSFRAHFTKPQYDNLTVSYSDRSGPVNYTVSAAALSGRGGLGGPVTITNASGNVIETRDQVYHSEYHEFVFKTKLGLDGPGSSIGNLSLTYNPYWSPQFLGDERFFPNGERRSRENRQKKPGYNADMNADYDFAIGPGRLKAIGLYHREHAPNTTTQILTFDTTGADPVGTRFIRDARYLEEVARGEYSWKGGKNDWQFSLERAFNSLDQRGSLFDLKGGEFVPVPFPEGTGKVSEVRYEAIASLSRALTPNLDMQFAAGAETSKLDRVDDKDPARKFFRPKGSLTLAWRPAEDWDISLKLRRRVGQIDFLDFLSQPQLSDDRENAGNAALVPPQSWEVETEFAHDLGKWGKARLNLHYYDVTDIIDVIPIGTDEQGIGNLPKAKKAGAETTNTFNLDPLGFKGAKIDFNAGFEWSSVKDPLTGKKRAISGNYDHWGSFEFRHDIPNTPFAWGFSGQHNHYAKYYYLTEISRTLDIPWGVGAFVEHKNLAGLTFKASVFAPLPGRPGYHLFDRTVYSGFRDRSPIAFHEHLDGFVGPIFNFSIKGTF